MDCFLPMIESYPTLGGLTVVEASSLLGARIVAHRKKKKLTQAQLAENAKINVNTLCRIEVGSHQGLPSFTTISLIAEALDVNVFALLGGKAQSSVR